MWRFAFERCWSENESIVLLRVPQIWYFVFIDQLGWDAQDQGQYLSFSGIARIVYMLVLFPIISRLFSKQTSTAAGKIKFDLNIIRLCVLVSIVCVILDAFAPNGTVLYAIAIFESFATLALPTIQSMLSSSVPKENQGLLFAGLGFCTTATGLLMGVVYPTIWSKTVSTVPNAFFFMGALLYCFGFLTFVILVSHQQVVSDREKVNPDNFD